MPAVQKAIYTYVLVACVPPSCRTAVISKHASIYVYQLEIKATRFVQGREVEVPCLDYYVRDIGAVVFMPATVIIYEHPEFSFRGRSACTMARW